MVSDPHDIRSWKRRPDGITTSGKLQDGDLERLAAIGVNHVINLAPDEHPEALEDEAEKVSAAAMQYTYIPVPFDAPSLEHVDQMQAAIEAGPKPVHIHCIANFRVTAFLYLLDLEAGVSKEEARSRMAEVWDPIGSDEPRFAAWRKLLS